MAIRDTSRIRVKFFAQTTAPTGTGAAPDPVNASSNVYMCLVDGPNWSGFTRGDVETTCSNTTLDAWGNLIRQYEAGKLIDLGTHTHTHTHTHKQQTNKQQTNKQQTTNKQTNKQQTNKHTNKQTNYRDWETQALS